MKLIEAMNELKLTEKKLQQKLAFVQRYSARADFREDAFKDNGGERKKVAEAVQACNDLIQKHEELKRAIDFTNLTAKVKIGKREYSIHSLILHKRFLLKLKSSVYGSLNDSQAKSEVAQLLSRGTTDQKVSAQVVYNFDLMEKEEKQSELAELGANIDSALQIANAKIDLAELPKL